MARNWEDETSGRAEVEVLAFGSQEQGLAAGASVRAGSRTASRTTNELTSLGGMGARARKSRKWRSRSLVTGASEVARAGDVWRLASKRRRRGREAGVCVCDKIDRWMRLEAPSAVPSCTSVPGQSQARPGSGARGVQCALSCALEFRVKRVWSKEDGGRVSRWGCWFVNCWSARWRLTQGPRKLITSLTRRSVIHASSRRCADVESN